MSVVRRTATDAGGRVALVIDRPRGNVLTRETLTELGEAIAVARADRVLRLLTIEGAGPDFSFGASVEEHRAASVGPTLAALHAVIRDLLDLPAPTAAIVRGRCLGGGLEVVLACDLVFAEAGATLGVPEVSLGVFPPAAAALLPARIGASRAAGVILSGGSRPAAWWRDAGLVECVADPGMLAAEVDAWYAAACARRSAVALGHAAQAARLTLRRAVLPALEELEHQYLDGLMASADAGEGIEAFLDKRAPRWRHA